MPYDEQLATRVRAILADRPNVTERKMFGGVGFMLAGNMCAGVMRDDLIVRLRPDEGKRALEEPDVRLMDFTRRPMTGFVVVGPAAIATDADLRTWVERGAAYASSLPPK